MKNIFPIFILLVLFVACDDGDIITAELDFEDTLTACGELVLYKIKEDPAESLSLQITNPNITLEDLIETDGEGNLLETEAIFTINANTNRFFYRSYNQNPESFFCNDIPPANIEITKNDESPSGEVTIYTTLTEDDQDGIDKELEDINGNGDLTDDDTDNDGIPNYLDEDDDGDNVLTRLEIDTENVDADDNPITNPLDTDADGIPDYLDTDDDGDGVNTINEENNTQDQNPTNDFTNPSIADYLNPNINSSVAATAYRDHIINQVFDVNVYITGLDLNNLTIIDPYFFGKLKDESLTKQRTVEIAF